MGPSSPISRPSKFNLGATDKANTQIHRQADSRTERQTGRQTGRQTDRQTDGQANQSSKVHTQGEEKDLVGQVSNAAVKRRGLRPEAVRATVKPGKTQHGGPHLV